MCVYMIAVIRLLPDKNTHATCEPETDNYTELCGDVLASESINCLVQYSKTMRGSPSHQCARFYRLIRIIYQHLKYELHAH